MSSSSITDFWAHTQSPTYQLNINWTIDNFPFYLQDDPKEFVSLKSPPCSASGHEDVSFYLGLFPNSQKKEDKDYLSLYLYCNSPNFPAPVYVKYKMSIIDREGKDPYSINGPCKFTSTLGFGHPKLIARFVLLNPANGLLPNDQLTIRCEATICFDLNDQSSLSSRIVSTDLEQYEKQFNLDMISLLENAKYGDVTLSVDGIKLSAHKDILSVRSPVFDAMFNHENTKEAQESKVEIVDVPAGVFQDLLRFIYTGKVPEKERLTTELLVASDKYQVEGLKSACENHLSTLLSIESAATTLLFADMHGAASLKVNCLKYISINILAIMSTDAWINMAQVRPELMREISHMSSKKTSLKRAREE